MTADQILARIKKMADEAGYVFIPEFTWNDLRIDALIIEPRSRYIRGFEIKVSRGDWLADGKWQQYAQFCSTLSIVCPEGLIQSEEVPKQFGLAWVAGQDVALRWKRLPKKFNGRDLAWIYRYVEVIEKELPRLVEENNRLRWQLRDAEARYTRKEQQEVARGS